MSTKETAGADLHSEDAEARRQAARMLGSARTEKKSAAARANGAKNVVTEEKRAKLREAQAARRERERLEREALGIVAEPAEKKQRGRPRTKTADEGLKRGRGRPKKQDGQISTEGAFSTETGAQTQETAS